MRGPVTLTDVPGLLAAIRAAGHDVSIVDDAWIATDAAAVQAIIDGYDPLPFVRAEKVAALAARRYEAEIGGVTVGGIAVATDDRAKIMIAGARIKAEVDPNATFRWKTAAGFVDLMAAQLIAISDAVLAHVQACFDREAELAAEIDALTDWQAIAAIDISAGWPA